MLGGPVVLLLGRGVQVMSASDQSFGIRELEQTLDDSVFASDGACHLGRRGLDGHGLDVLRATIEGEIIPRLMLAHRVATTAQSKARERRATHVSVEEVAQMILAEDSKPVVDYVRGLREGGMSVERVLLEVLAPTAKRLGELWTADRCTFTEVTLALGRLQYLLHDLSLADHESWAASTLPRRALIIPVPGEQHTFGSSMVAEFLRRDGWEVCSEPCATAHQLATALQHAEYELLGFSLSLDRGISGLESSIETARRESSKRELSIMVGGRVFDQRPRLVDEVGADGTANDAATTVAAAAALVAEARPAGDKST